GNLPSVVVSDLVYHDKDQTLTAATYGRGIWRISPGNLRRPPAGKKRHERIEIAAGLRVDPSISRPLQLAPADGAVIDDPLRRTVVTVKPVPHALGYQVELAAEGSSMGFGSMNPEIAFNGFGRGKARWRVWAILPDGLRSAASPWREINYSQ